MKKGDSVQVQMFGQRSGMSGWTEVWIPGVVAYMHGEKIGVTLGDGGKGFYEKSQVRPQPPAEESE